MSEQPPPFGEPADATRPRASPSSQPEPGAGAGYAGPAYPADQATGQRSFLGSLFDFGFTSFVTSRVVKFLYVLVVALAAAGALLMALISFHFGAVFGLITLFIIAPLYFVVVTAIYRIFLEFAIVVFRIADDVQAIRQRGGFGEGTRPGA